MEREEFSSFHPGLVLTGAAGVAWRPRKSVLEFKPLDDAPPPAPTDTRRLLQMKELARGFAIKESFRGDVSVLRLLPHPIDRWEDREAGIDDGAMFAFTYGTNPELVLLLECQSGEWQFALARLGGAELIVTRDDVTLQTFPELDGSAQDDAYTSQTIAVPLPGAGVTRESSVERPRKPDRVSSRILRSSLGFSTTQMPVAAIILEKALGVAVATGSDADSHCGSGLTTPSRGDDATAISRRTSTPVAEPIPLCTRGVARFRRTGS